MCFYGQVYVCRIGSKAAVSCFRNRNCWIEITHFNGDRTRTFFKKSEMCVKGISSTDSYERQTCGLFDSIVFSYRLPNSEVAATKVWGYFSSLSHVSGEESKMDCDHRTIREDVTQK